MKLNPYYTPLTKINLKWIKDLNVMPETVKLLEQEKSSLTLVLEMFSEYNTKSTRNKSKNKQVRVHQTKKLLHSKETINKVKRSPIKWEKIFANHILSDKGLIMKIYKELIQLNSKKTNKPMKILAKDLKKHFTKTYKWPTGTEKSAHHD